MENYYKKKGFHYYYDCLEKIKNQRLSYDDKRNNKNEYTYNKFELWVFMTQNCNCNCTYCKQKELKKSNNAMTEDILKFILDECVKIHNKKIVKQFSINLSGGEPFLVFDMFKGIVPYYKSKYPEIFHFTSVTNVTIITDEIINWIKTNLDNNICASIDDIEFSKPINGISSSKVQMNNVLSLKKEKINVSCLSVFDNQKSLMPLAEFAINNFCHWRILSVKPYRHTKIEILDIAKPVLKFVFNHNKHRRWFDFDGWDLWSKKRVSGCICGKTFLGILPDTETLPNNGELLLKLGKFNSDLLSILNHPNNEIFKKRFILEMCDDCELKNECDGACRACHFFPEKMKERCDALKELFEYVQTLKR